MRFSRFISSSAICLLILAAAGFGFGQKGRVVGANDFKQLAGAAEEIGAMRLPNPADTGLRSRAAMIAVRGGTQKIEIPVESADNFRVMILAQNSREWSVRAVLPGGESFDPRKTSAFTERIESFYGLDGEQYPAEVLAFKDVPNGILSLEINSPKTFAKDAISGYLVASSDTPYQLYSYINTSATIKNHGIGLIASLYDSSIGEQTALAQTIAESKIEIKTPSGKTVGATMFDDGVHADRLAGDGVFGGVFTPREAGRYVAQITTRGTAPNGEAFIRTAEHIFNVAAAEAEFTGSAYVRQTEENRYQIDLPLENLPVGQKFIAHAEVWGRDAAGGERSIAWIGGMVVTEKSFGSRRAANISLSLDAGWLARSEAVGDYELRNVRLQDADFAVTVGSADRINLPEIKVSEAVKSSYTGEITPEMQTGKRPSAAVENAVGGRLMLVHGYCSGDAWGAPAAAGQFTNYVKFLDLNKNRSHDQFAQLIKNFGANLPSFGIVAHSQGGAAALHLYTYYWSGLDNATGGTRLIQSVGTPYQGTALAGNLALLGQIFGAGCGSNTDLSYSGAASWLAGIPSWARAKVSYHTTSFEDVWYRYDYCNIATDPFLGDPEDGVVERAYAQLPGAINLGHKTGWCHTGGMRDPGQTSDSARNSNMNANAAR